MDKKHPEAIKIQLGDEERVLKISMGAFRYAKMKHGVEMNLTSLISGDVAAISTLVWIALLPDDPELTEEQVIIWLMQSPDEAEILGHVIEAVKRFAETVEKLGNAAKALTK